MQKVLNNVLIICFVADVGNKAAVFPLQLLGFDVDVVNSVHFSNHTGYAEGFEGDILKGEQLTAILNGLERNGLLSSVGHLLTGYIGSVSFLESVLDVLKTIKKYNNNVRFVCDPVLGDNNKFYVPVELVKVFRDQVIPLADVITPNQFEAEKLTGLKIMNMEDAMEACARFHAMGPSLVFITSLVLPNESKQFMAILASKQTPSGKKVWRIDCPVLPGSYTGTGDLCASLLLAHTATTPDDVPLAIEKVINTMHSVIERTYQMSGETIQSRELKLIQSKHDIENPPERFKAVQLQ